MTTKFNHIYQQVVSENEVSEGMLSKVLGTALAGTLSLASPSFADKDQPEPTKMSQADLANLTNRRIQQNIIARTLWAEGRNGGEKSMRGVASVIHKRGQNDPDKMVKAIKVKYAFSCWNKMNWKDFTFKQREGIEWGIANRIALELMNGTFKPIVDATNYYNPDKVTHIPSWAYINGKHRPYVLLGGHRFMNV
jgi:spore germination cell wall hydrolase CwlJ-like protein